MKHDSFLNGILAGITLLICAALFVQIKGIGLITTYQSEDTGAGVVMNYILALRAGDLEKAYGYISDDSGKPTYSEFLANIKDEADLIKNGVVIIDPEDLKPDITEIHFGSHDASNLDYSGYGGTAIVKKENGAWKITDMPYPYFDSDWYLPE